MTHPTPPEAAKPGDLDDAECQLATDPYAEDATCPRCHSPFGCDDELEPSIFCHNCAHEVAESVTPLLVAELRTLREAQRCPKVEPLDLEMLEQCAKLIRDLNEFGMSNMRASRLRLLADWATVYEKAALPPDAPKGEL